MRVVGFGCVEAVVAGCEATAGCGVAAGACVGSQVARSFAVFAAIFCRASESNVDQASRPAWAVRTLCCWAYK